MNHFILTILNFKFLITHTFGSRLLLNVDVEADGLAGRDLQLNLTIIKSNLSKVHIHILWSSALNWYCTVVVSMSMHFYD